MLRGVQAQDVMKPANLVRIPPDLTLQDAVDRYFMRYDHSAFPVDEYGRTIGLLTLREGSPGYRATNGLSAGCAIIWSRSVAKSWCRRMPPWIK